VIISRFDGRLLVVRQADHGVQSGGFGAAWAGISPIDSFRESRLVEAAVRHDNGWAPWDAKPQLDPQDGRPAQFVRVPRHSHVGIYGRGIAEAAEADPYVGLLVSMHGVGLYNDRYGTFRLREQDFTAEEKSVVHEFLQDQEQVQKSLLGACGYESMTSPQDIPEIWRDYLLLQVWDRLSLQFIWKSAQDGMIAPVPGFSEGITCTHAGEFCLKLDPYPFVDSPSYFPVEARLVADREYRSAEDFLAEYLTSPMMIVECKAVA
jgi:hypothetical protein